jgi:hypothetical protein
MHSRSAGRRQQSELGTRRAPPAFRAAKGPTPLTGWATRTWKLPMLQTTRTWTPPAFSMPRLWRHRATIPSTWPTTRPHTGPRLSTLQPQLGFLGTASFSTSFIRLATASPKNLSQCAVHSSNTHKTISNIQCNMPEQFNRSSTD